MATGKHPISTSEALQHIHGDETLNKCDMKENFLIIFTILFFLKYFDFFFRNLQTNRVRHHRTRHEAINALKTSRKQVN